MHAAAPLLVMRFSALGDVAMTVPVLRLVLEQNPSLRICMVSNRAYAPLFSNIERLTFVGADLKGAHRGIIGLLKLYRALHKAGPYRGIADLHSVLRSRLLAFLFTISGTRSVRLNKGRAEKRKLTSRSHKELRQLPTAFERMQAVFTALGLSCHLPATTATFASLATAKSNYTIGIAPFARHNEKAYPVSLLKELIAILHVDSRLTIQLVGGGGAEAMALAALEKEFAGVHSIAGRFSLAEELVLLGKLDLMISMDSANMHLASLCNVPVISIWGATHRYAGFMGWGQPDHHAVEVSLSCRPCSVFGNKRCHRGDHACMQQIAPVAIAEKLYRVLGIAAPEQA